MADEWNYNVLPTNNSWITIDQNFSIENVQETKSELWTSSAIHYHHSLSSH
jgi:hypothetical protein